MWIHAMDGVLAIVLAVILHFAVGELSGTTADALPGPIGAAYARWGMAGLTVPLVVIGMAMILFDIWRHQPSRTPGEETASRPSSRRKLAAQTDEELEFGEPIPDEVAAPTPPVPTKKVIPAGPARPAAAPTPQAEGGGGMVLTSAKYLNQNPGRGGPGNLRKGRTEHTNTEE
jgi:hypothetical protein